MCRVSLWSTPLASLRPRPRPRPRVTQWITRSGVLNGAMNSLLSARSKRRSKSLFQGWLRYPVSYRLDHCQWPRCAVLLSVVSPNGSASTSASCLLRHSVWSAGAAISSFTSRTEDLPVTAPWQYSRPTQASLSPHLCTADILLQAISS